MVFPRTGRGWHAFARAAIIAGAALRVVVILDLYSPLDRVYSDSLGYVERAMRVVAAAPLDHYDAFYPPGTHLLLAIPFWLLGNDRTGLVGGAVLWTVLSSLTPYFMWRYARLLLSPAAASLTALFCAVWPIHIAYGGHFMSEVPSFAFMTAALWLAERAHRIPSDRRAVAAGVAAALTVAQRPALVLNVAVAAWPLLRDMRTRRRLAALAAGGLLFAIAPVVAYATAASGHLTLSENSGLVFYMGHCNVKAVEAGPQGSHYSFESPVTTQLNRGVNVNYPDHDIWDQGFFYAQGLSCIANDGVGHVHMLLRNVFDMGLSTVPWPPSNDPWVRDIVKLANIGYVVALPFIVLGALRLIRRRWPYGGARGEFVMLVQLSMMLVTAIVYFGDPRYRTPYDVFGLALAASLIADRFFDSASESAHPNVAAEHAVQEHADRALVRSEPASEVDAVDSRAAEADRGATIGAHDHARDGRRGTDLDQPVSREPLAAVANDMHQEPAVGPARIEPQLPAEAEPSLTPRAGPIHPDAPERGIDDEEAARVAAAGERSREEEDTVTIHDR